MVAGALCATLGGCSGSEGAAVSPGDSSVVDAGGIDTADIDAVADGTAPPSVCTPACLWNLFKDCRVIAPCFDEAVDGGTRSCRPSTGVTWFTDGAGRTVYRSDGTICYTVVFGDPSTWKDATGSIVAVVKAISPTDYEAACDGSTFDFHPNTPECQIALGSAESCTRGSCPP